MATVRIQIPIDKAGRVVLPKEVRERLGVQPGTELEVIEEANRIILRPVEKEAKTVVKNGLLVIVPDKDYTRYGEEDPVKLAREERDKKLL